MLEFNLKFFVIFSLVSFFFTYLIAKYSKQFFSGSLLDKDFLKPQAFHKEAITRCGGISSLLSLLILISIHYLLYSDVLSEYIFICTGFFLVGFLDDIKIKVSPNLRLAIMTIFLLLFINILSVEITSIDLIFLNTWLQNKIFLNIFIVLCFLFITNGANLIDGFNGLLTINLIIINSVLLYINLDNNFFEFSFFLIGQIIILISFLFFIFL